MITWYILFFYSTLIKYNVNFFFYMYYIFIFCIYIFNEIINYNKKQYRLLKIKSRYKLKIGGKK